MAFCNNDINCMFPKNFYDMYLKYLSSTVVILIGELLMEGNKSYFYTLLVPT